MLVKVTGFLLGLYSLHRVWGFLFVLCCKGGMEKKGKDQVQLIIIFKRHNDLLHLLQLFQIK